MKSIAVRCAVVVAALTSLVVGCAQETPEGLEQIKYIDEETEQEGSDRIDLGQLRQDIRVVQRRLVSMGPDVVEGSIEESSNGVLMSCSGGRHQWTGSTTAEYSTIPAQENYYRLVESELEGSDELTASRQFSPDGQDEWLIVHGPDGTRYSITVWTDISKVQVSASSWCFTVRPGQTERGRF
ncbi:hypothetical protein [Frigoribacterium sp. VKM Ac-2836]|uniref:hypothetical protein n=1 Tax=Frigoribacterium sp. VKM Ac-2836 TaxID=2739014 RepID=UPI0015641EA3|nr:hypothetical protein [Frigoribacterium sp. VKM Ac-2836]NRD27753.1 hypothetical protein [Frigoribacterium sp. VKM Ac-2836]